MEEIAGVARHAVRASRSVDAAPSAGRLEWGADQSTLEKRRQ